MTPGPLMVDLEGTEITPVEREMLRHPATGGVILFSRNFADCDQLHALCNEIHGLREPPLLIAVDHEGGRVQRFHDGFTRLPPAATLGALYDRDARKGRNAARLHGWLMAAELRAFGVDLSFAPVLDLGRGISSVIGDRALHREPEAIAELAHEWMLGMHEAGMAATGKHFPGHGGVEPDSHVALPVDERRFEDLGMEDLVPFERMFHFGLRAVMMAHVVYPRVDRLPAGFSRSWIQGVLRGSLGFQGAVFSDDLSMAAAEVVGDFGDRALASLEAGCDMVLVCNHPDGAAQALERLENYEDPSAHVRLVRMHGQRAPGIAELKSSTRWQQASTLAARLDVSPELDLDLDQLA